MCVWVVEEEEFDVGGREEAGDEVILEAVDVFEVPVKREWEGGNVVCLALIIAFVFVFTDGLLKVDSWKGWMG